MLSGMYTKFNIELQSESRVAILLVGFNMHYIARFFFWLLLWDFFQIYNGLNALAVNRKLNNLFISFICLQGLVQKTDVHTLCMVPVKVVLKVS